MKTTTPLKGLDGKDMVFGAETYTVGRAIANLLVNAKSQDPMRAYVLGTKFFNEETVTLNQSDRDFIKNSTKNSEVAAIILGQVLALLDAKEEKPKTEEAPKS